ncbi:MAG: hypothetical protein WBX38_10130 [Candidatus Sulfotelmatobacter sp.]
MKITVTFRLIVTFFIAAAILFGVVSLWAKWQAYRAQTDARELVAELRGVRIGGSTLDDVGLVAARHTHYRRSFLKPDPPACDNGEDPCYFDFSYENSLLARLHLAPVIRFGVRVQVHQRRVDAIMEDLTCGNGPSTSGVVINEGLQPFTDRTIDVSEFSNMPSITTVRLTPNAPERDQIYGLNLKCLDQIGGCPNRSDFLPGLSQRK